MSYAWDHFISMILIWSSFSVLFALLNAMLHGFFYFCKIPVFDGYDMDMGVGYVSDTRTQFRHPDPLNFMIFEEKKCSY